MADMPQFNSHQTSLSIEMKKTTLILLFPNAAKITSTESGIQRDPNLLGGKSSCFRRDGRSNINSQSELQLRNTPHVIISSWAGMTNVRREWQLKNASSSIRDRFEPGSNNTPTSDSQWAKHF
jgi:hypothetical protein